MNKGVIEIPILTLEGRIINVTVYEQGSVAPTRIIRTDADWTINIEWELRGSAVPMIAGTWHTHIHLESLGPGGEQSSFDPDCNLPLNGGTNYHCQFDVAAGKLKTSHNGTPYRLLVTLNYRTVAGNPGPIAAYYDAGIFQFYYPV